MEEHLIQARIEDAEFLLAAGFHITQVARRLGVDLDCLEKCMERDKARRAG